MALTTFRYTSSATAVKKHTVVHNLDCAYPLVSVFDTVTGTTNFKQELSASAAIKTVDVNTITVEFNAPITCVVSVVAF
jgi:hypothetical protein